jgi:hypothetical protein
LLVALGAAGTPEAKVPPFEERIETEHAVLLFYREHRQHAQRVSEYIDEAVPLVAQEFGRPAGRVTVFIYGDDDAMARGLAAVLDYPQHEIDAVVRVGISARTRETLHIHSKTSNWNTEKLLHAIVDEHSQGVIEDRFGTRPAEHAAWLEEGLSSYVAYRALRSRLPALEEWFDTWSRKEAFKALVGGRLPSLDDLATREAWNQRITKDRRSWVEEYAFAYVAVSGLIDNYGLPALEEILEAIAGGDTYTQALQDVLGISLAEFEFRTKVTLVVEGVTGFYAKYTITAALGLLFLTAIVGAFGVTFRRLTK